MRTFIAVEIGDTARTAAIALQKVLARTGASVKWVESNSMHVTLVFLGEVDDRELPAVFRAVSKATAGEAPFPLHVAGVGAFPTPRRPKTLWAGITEGADRLSRLHERINTHLVDLGGYRREERAYTPHLTLGRVKSEEDGNLLAAELPKHLAWNGGQTVVSEVLVFSSELKRDGPEYTVLGRAELLGDPEE
ncbi:2'-5' RNA ligase [Fimbriiglobus ruber]|uniref:RNA 2',3'-cyclic phosphodiesterase n=1 Tax=Fimbriiglobus ruber TaxID=1908690 RepID=A0A225E956_9BACT|nr:2'-5' RNA ligase [Fimbriiglobus ruber]OWK44947.1 2'-5' RNA ligase [Fimbriiglobus ruber]